MAQFKFGFGPGHLPEKANEIAKEYCRRLVNYTDPDTGERHHWFTGPELGFPFDKDMAKRVLKALRNANINV